MPEPTLMEVLSALVAALEEYIESVARLLKAKTALEKLQGNSDMKNYETTVWTPAKSNEGTKESDLDALSYTDLDTWLTENKAEVDRLLNPPEE